MKLLFWIQPIIEHAWPSQKRCWVESFVPEIIKRLEPSEVCCCVSRDLKDLLLQQGVRIPGDVVAFSQDELLEGYNWNQKVERERYIVDGMYSAFYKHLEELLRTRIPHLYSPDVIISFNESPFLKRIYSNALHLSCELSVFSRPPYPMLFAFDPISDGNGSRFSSARFADEINSVQATSEDVASVQILRDAVTTSLMANKFIADYFSTLRNAYSRVVLIPLGAENYFDTLPGTAYSSQFEFVEHVLSSVDKNTCVVVTQHPTTRAIQSQGINDLKRLYQNFRNELWFGSVPNFSQVAMAYADACVCSQTSVAYQAAFLGKHLISPDGFCKGIADSTSVTDIGKVFDFAPINRTNYFAWLLRRYAIELDQLKTYLDSITTQRHMFVNPNIAHVIHDWPEQRTSDELRQTVMKWIENHVKPFACSLSTITPSDCIWEDADLTRTALAENVQLQGETKRLQGENARLQGENARLQGENARLHSYMDDLLHSRSWRLTKPLRAIAKVVRTSECKASGCH